MRLSSARWQGICVSSSRERFYHVTARKAAVSVSMQPSSWRADRQTGHGKSGSGCILAGNEGSTLPGPTATRMGVPLPKRSSDREASHPRPRKYPASNPNSTPSCQVSSVDPISLATQNGPGGYGIFQLTWKSPPVPRNILWNWQANVQGGIHELQGKLGISQSLLNGLQALIPPRGRSRII
jgi:hypothetical protein